MNIAVVVVMVVVLSVLAVVGYALFELPRAQQRLDGICRSERVEGCVACRAHARAG